MSSPSSLDLTTAEGITSAFLEHAVTLSDLREITADELEAVYAEACDRIAEEKYSEAIDSAMFLVTNQPWDRRFQFAFGLCLQGVGDYESAARHYSQAYVLDASDAGCAYRIGECMESLGQFDEAREAYKSALDLSFIGSGLPEVRDAAQSRLDELNQR